MPPEYPEITFETPKIFSNDSSMHQKHPPAKYALSKFGEFAKLVEESNKKIIDKNFFTLLLSYCPGGIYEVAVIAIFFNLDPEFVSFHHIIRLLMILFIVPVILRFF